LLASIAACVAINLPIDGVVLDDSTSRPLPGALVIAKWVTRSADLVGSRTGCTRVEVVQADDKGRYRLPASDVVSLGTERLVFSYKPGYEWFEKNAKSMITK
jgi:hypothetical protein